jgi:hypothetical protein
MEALVYIANLLSLSAYFMQDLLRLRLLAIVATLCSVCYFYFPGRADADDRVLESVLHRAEPGPDRPHAGPRAARAAAKSHCIRPARRRRPSAPIAPIAVGPDGRGD